MRGGISYLCEMWTRNPAMTRKDIAGIKINQ
jgi:hypothetical protein